MFYSFFYKRWYYIKKIKLTIFGPEKELSNGIEYEVSIEEEGTIIEALATLDRQLLNNPKLSPFPLYKGLIKSYLQLIWDPQKNAIYEDCASNAYGPNKAFMPLLDDVSFNLYPNSDITLIVHADWWADNMRERLDFGTFKRVIMKKYGKEHDTFAHYFITKIKD